MELSISPITEENSVEAGSEISVSLWSKEATPGTDLHWTLETAAGDYHHELDVPFAETPVPGAISYFKITAPDSSADALSIREGIGTPFEIAHEILIVAPTRP